MISKAFKYSKKLYNEYVGELPRCGIIGKFREYVTSDEGKDISCDVCILHSDGKGIEKAGTFITLSNIFYKNDDVKIQTISAETTGEYTPGFVFTVIGEYKNKPFEIKFDDINMHNIIYNHGIENEDKKEYNKTLHEGDKRITVKMPYGMKKYLYNTFATRNLLYVLNYLCESIYYKNN